MSSTGVPQSYPTHSMVGDRYTLLLTGEQTAGAYAVVEAFVPPGGGPPAHVHSREDEAFLVVEGESEFAVGGERLRLTAGGFVSGPCAGRRIGHAGGGGATGERGGVAGVREPEADSFALVPYVKLTTEVWTGST